MQVSLIHRNPVDKLCFIMLYSIYNVCVPRDKRQKLENPCVELAYDCHSLYCNCVYI